MFLIKVLHMTRSLLSRAVVVHLEAGFVLVVASCKDQCDLIV